MGVRRGRASYHRHRAGEPMTNPIPLSPAAQAVRDAVLATYADNIPKDDNLWALERASVVAALRAAALYCPQERRILMTIADELDS